jgi:hypothetical protein
MREVLCPVVVGRDEELAVLEESLEEARVGAAGRWRTGRSPRRCSVRFAPAARSR